MKWFNNQKDIVKYLMCSLFVFALLFIARLIFVKEDALTLQPDRIYIKNNIYTETENELIDVDYPKFKDEKVNQVITNWVYRYIKEFKENSKDKESNKLEINYSLYFKDNYVNILFDINNSLKPKDIYKSMLINLPKATLSDITEVYDKAEIEKELLLVSKKYPSFVSQVILQQDINNFDYLVGEDGYAIFFTNLTYEKEISYTPELKINLNMSVQDENEETLKKPVALTFDDGPSELSLEILECLKLNDSKATFFELGMRMKNNQEIVKQLHENGMEIGNHTYSHKNLTKLKISEALEEINSTSIIFNEITSSYISLMRAPYGGTNSQIRKNAPLPIISWSIDTKDWLYKDPQRSAEIVLNSVKEGDIILMHDVHETTIELVKIIVPELKARGFELATVSELAEQKNYTLKPGVIVSKIK